MSGRRKNRYDKSVYRSFALVMQFGINMLVPICMLSALGIYLDRKFGTSYIMVILFFVGAAAGGRNVFRMAKNIYEEPQTKTERESDKTDTVHKIEKDEKESDIRNEAHGDIKKGK